MVKSPTFFLAAAISLAVLSLVASEVDGEENMAYGVKPVTTSNLDDVSGSADSEEPEGETTITGACSQATNSILRLLNPCSAAVSSLWTTPSSACCSSAETITDACFCYLESLLPGSNLGFTADDAIRVARACGRTITQC